jgi:hypothetical protein
MMALYSLAEVQALVEAGEWDYLHTRRAFITRENLNWTDNDIALVLCALSESDWQTTALRCTVENPSRIGSKFIDADQYEIFWDVELKVRRSGPVDGTVALSLKVAIASDVGGKFTGVVNLHTSGS